MPKYTNRLKHKSHYENVPFEVPEGWCWVKIRDLCYYLGGYAFKSTQYVASSDNQVIRIGNVKDDKILFESQPVFITDDYAVTAKSALLKNNDLLFTMTGTKGKRDYFKTSLVRVGKKRLFLNQRVGCLRSYSTHVYMEYLCLAMKHTCVLDAIFQTETGNVSQGNIGSENTLDLLIPLPPLNEQKRIVQRFQDCISDIDSVELNTIELKKVIERLKSQILDLAIHGKLVPQDPNDEPAIELLKRINPKFVPCDNAHYENVPFEVPKNWLWLSHNAILNISGGSQPAKSHFKSKEEEGYIRLYQIRDYGETPVPVYIPRELASKTTQKGDILLARYGGSLGKVFIAEEGAYNVAMAKVIFKYNGLINKKYAYFYYLSSLYQDKLKSISRTAQAGFNSTDFEDMFFPLPPIAEQERIVGAINQYYRILDNISANL